MKTPKPPKPTAEGLRHPNSNEYVAWNGDIRKKRSTDRWNGAPEFEDKGFTSRVSSSSGNHLPRKREVINGQYVWVDPMEKEVTHRTIKPAPRSLIVGGHERGRHEPLNNQPTHYSPGYQRPRGAPQSSDLKLRQEGTDGKAR